MELLIMAAGMGSRFGGLKQVTPMGPNDEFIIDYSIFDAIKAGFNKVVFIIKEENYDLFRKTVGKRVEKYIDTEYVFQKIEDVPSFVQIPETRVKPWGTAQAIYAAKDKITEDFVVINADDFYGRDAFLSAKELLSRDVENKYGVVGYKAINTMTDNGSVKRGVIYTNNDNLVSIKESILEIKDGKIIATPLEGGESFVVNNDDLVSMNMLTFDLSIFDYIKEKMDEFFIKNKDNLDKCEFLIPILLDEAVKEGKKVKVKETNASWYGVTYKEDAPIVKENIKKLVLNNEYPNNLWKK